MCLTSLIRSRCMCGNRFWLSLFRAFIAICVCVCLGMKVECGGSIRFLSHCVCFVNVLGFVPTLFYVK